MSNNTRLNPGFDGDTIRTLENSDGSKTQVVTNGFVSTSNSTAVALAGSATYTGTGEDVSQYSSVLTSCKTDLAGTLYMEFSTDNSNWDSSLSFSVAADTNEVHRMSVSKKYFRARFTNGSGSAQTYLRLQTIAGIQPPLTSALNSTVQLDADAMLVRAAQAITVSTSNNSTANLASLAVFTGTGETTLNVAGIQFTFVADQFCTVEVQQDSDTTFTSAHRISDSFNFDPVIGAIGYTVQAVGAYFRIVVTNTSSSTTTLLELNSILCPMVEALPRALDARGRLKVGVSNFGFDVGRSVYPGITYNNKFGRNADTVTGDAIWAQSSAYNEIQTAGVIAIVSTSTDDDGDPVGIGARTLTLTGLNGSYDIVTETVTMNGTTPVNTTNSYFAVHRCFVATAGSSATQVGTITGTQASATPATTVIRLVIGYNQTQSAQYMVPRNYSAYINLININAQNVTNNATLDLGLFKKTFGGVYRIQADWLMQGGAGTSIWMPTEYGTPLKFEAKSNILFKCIVAANGTWDVRVDYDIYLVADSAV